MKKVIFAMVLTAVIVLSSCSSGVLSDEDGTILISGLEFSGSRSLTVGWPTDSPPVFSSCTVRVSGPDMETLTFTKDSPGDSVWVRAPQGQDRLIELIAVPDWDATAARNPTIPVTPLVKSFYGYQTIDVAAHRTQQVTIALGVGETKILLPEIVDAASVIKVADSIASATTTSYPALNLSGSSSFKFDQHGRLILSTGGSLDMFMSLADAPIKNIASSYWDDLAFDAKNQRIYAYYDSDGANLSYYSLTEASPAAIMVNAPFDYFYQSGSIAVDSDGYVYAILSDTIDSILYLVKLRILPAVGTAADSEIVDRISLESLGLGYSDDPNTPGWNPLEVNDMLVKDGMLIMTGSQVSADGLTASNSRSRGKIIGIRLAGFTKSWDTGWSGSGNFYPTNANTQLYGPGKIVGMGLDSLFVIDEGFSWNGQPTGDVYTDVDRILEIDTKTGAIKAFGLKDSSTFFSKYNYPILA